ncbi:MAG TPA: zinc ribbon domain-containing protein [Gemmatimonadales bacterium]|nr:zinc ribbon domain-containing protein [Gemmatimonadales bacterium]
MFCPKCGTQLPDGSVACSSCGTTFGGTAPRTMVAGGAGDRMKAASSDAFAAFKTFATNPVGGLSEAYDGLGAGRALAVGITFGVVFALCIVLTVYRILPGFFPGIGGFLKILVIAVVPFVALFASAAGVRTVFRGEGALGSDSFMAGAALLPFGVVALVMSLLGSSMNSNVSSFLGIFAITLTILMLFAGITRINKITERMATLGIPLMLIVTAWLSKLIYSEMIKASFGGGGFQGMPPGMGQ